MAQTRLRFVPLTVLLVSLLLVSIPISETSADSSATLPPSPILAFSFDNVTSSNVPDDSGSGNTYSISAYDRSGPFTPVTGRSFSRSGNAMDFNGFRKQRIEVNGPALTVEAFTIMADIRLQNPPNFTDPQRWEISEKGGVIGQTFVWTKGLCDQVRLSSCGSVGFLAVRGTRIIPA